MSPPSPLLSSSLLRLATFNLGLGFSRKLPDILDRCLALSLDVIAPQEIGDPALTRTIHSQYLFIASPGPSAHDSGVGLLIAHDLAPRCRAFKRSSSGRLVGVILELTKGHHLLIVSAYMPTGLDHRSPSDEPVQTAHKLYQEMMSWTRGVQQIVFMGDLNETLTSYDRHPRPAPVGPRAAAAATPSPIQCLIDEGFTDVYRLLHPDARRQPGFTHFIDSTTQCSRSCIDYIWTRGAPAASHLDIHIDAKLRDISHHRLVWMDLHLQREPSPPCARPLYHMKLPNLRDLSPEQQEEGWYE
jgi:exonuclease III